MDIERGNIEILFRKINYMAIGRQIDFGEKINRSVHSHKNINKKLYMQCAENIFSYMNEDERVNAYLSWLQKKIYAYRQKILKISDISGQLLLFLQHSLYFVLLVF